MLPAHDVPWIGSLATNGQTAVAAGGRWSSPRARVETDDGVVWFRGATSAWHEAAHMPDHDLNDVAAFAGGYVAVGTRLERTDFFDNRLQRHGAIWTSADGASWGPLPSDLLAWAGDNKSLTAVTSLGGGFLAAGWQWRDVPSEHTVPLIVVSPDGTHLVAEPGAAPEVFAAFSDACTAPDGSIYLVGTFTGANAGPGDALLWRRDPAGGWTVPSLPGGAGPEHDFLNGCYAAADGTLTVVGGEMRDGDGEPVVYTSRDGVRWRSVEGNGLGGPGDQQADAVVALPDGRLLLTGLDHSADDDAALWIVSPEGEVARIDEAETSLRAIGSQRGSAVVIVGERVILAGTDHGRAGLWEAPVGDIGQGQPRD